MLGWLRKEALLDAGQTAWQFECFDWLLRHTGGQEALRSRRLILPTPEFFPQRAGTIRPSPKRSSSRSRCTPAWMGGRASCSCRKAIPTRWSRRMRSCKGRPSRRRVPIRALGESALITYHPDQLANPLALVATFAHELAHYRTARFAEPPPGGWELWEIATDLAAVFLGFGVLLANTRFQCGHFDDGRVSGWRWRQQGYMFEPELLHMQAIVSMATGAPQGQTLTHLKPPLRGIYKRVWKDAALASQRLQGRNFVHMRGLIDRGKPMAKKLALLAALVSLGVNAQDLPFHFSRHSPALHLGTYDPQDSKVSFRGSVPLRGRVFFEFDSDDGKRGNGATDFAFFVPDAESRSKLPTATMATYDAKDMEYVSLQPADAVLRRLYGTRKARVLSHGASLVVIDEVDVVITHFSVSVECDSIRYSAAVARIRPVAPILAANGSRSPPGGC